MSLGDKIRGLWKRGWRSPQLAASAPFLYVLRKCIIGLKDVSRVEANLLFLVQSCLDRMQEKLNIGNWKEVPLSDRQMITLLSFHQIWLYAMLNNELENNSLVLKILDIVDRGLLFGAPLQSPFDNLLHKCAEIASAEKTKEEISEDTKFSDLSSNKFFENKTLKFGEPLSIEVCPSLLKFKEKYMKPRLPVILSNCIDNWPALKLWNNPKYIINKIGDRVVPVELGSKYTDSDWTQKLMRVSDFIKEYIFDVPSTVGYLAQHQLFDQIPELLPDFSTPDYCCLHDENSNDDSVDVNAWFGPSSTISPLHTDPKHNLLCQVFGEKLIILLSPEDTPYLYCHSNNLLQNTSRVDPINPDYESFPEFSKAKMYFHLLKPGEILYIPPSWWHYVTSMKTSFSISFWWT